MPPVPTRIHERVHRRKRHVQPVLNLGHFGLSLTEPPGYLLLCEPGILADLPQELASVYHTGNLITDVNLIAVVACQVSGMPCTRAARFTLSLAPPPHGGLRGCLREGVGEREAAPLDRLLTLLRDFSS